VFVVKTVLIAGILATLFSGALMAIWVITDFFGPHALYVVMLVASLGVSSILYLMHKH
jgi:hypothetical protein